VLLELRVSTLPTDDQQRSSLAQYAATLAQEIPGLQDIVLAPAVTVATAASYAAILTAMRDAVHAALPAIRVGPLLDGSDAPKATVAALARSLASDDVIAFRPAAAADDGVWTAADVPQLVDAIEASFGEPAPPVLIDGLAIPTTIPSGELGAYPIGQKPAPDAIPPKEQGKAYAAAITAAACSTTVTGVILDRLVDSTAAPAASSGVFFAGGGAKASASLVAAAAPPAQRGTVVCPGLASRAGADTLEFPAELAASAPAAVLLACVRDCMYLITLGDARGRPVAARRGTLRGGGRPLTLELPEAKLDERALYRLDVRLVDRVNPGAVTRLTSAALPVSRP
jgi:hypothetical protein